MAADSAIQELEKKLADSKAVRRQAESQMLLNLAYHAGKQWVAYDGTMLFEPQLEDWRAKPVDNRIRPTVRTEIARMTKTRPVWVGTPKDQSDEELAAARLREDVFVHYWKKLQLTRKLRMALMWSRVTGAGFLKIYWDSTLGGKMDVLLGPDGQVLKDPESGGPMKPELLETFVQAMGEAPEGIKPKRIGMGDVRVGLRTPFEIYPDDLATEEGIDESCEWLIEESVHSVAHVAEHFGEELPADASASFGATESRMPSALGLRRDDGRKTGVKLREFWALPSSEHPRGKWCVWAGEKLLKEDDIPYPKLPYVMFSGSPVPGRFWPDTIVTDQVPQQTSLNKREAQVEENAERIGNPPLVRSAATDDVEWHGLPGEELVFQDQGTPGSIPQFLAVPELPMYVREDIDRRIAAMREIAGHYEISSGGVPAGVTAAAAINLLLEQNDTVLAPDIGDMEDALTGLGQRLLSMLHAYADDERMIRIAGDDGAWDVRAFKGKDLRDCEEDGIQVGSGIPQSKAAKQAALQEVLNMFAQAGVPLNERDLRKVMQEYEVGGLEKFFASIGRDERQITRENQRLANGEPLEINTYDDDELHIMGHQDFQKSSRYDALPDPIKAGFETHVQKHVLRHQASAPLDPEAAGVDPEGEGIDDAAGGTNGAGPRNSPTGGVPSGP